MTQHGSARHNSIFGRRSGRTTVLVAVLAFTLSGCAASASEGRGSAGSPERVGPAVSPTASPSPDVASPRYVALGDSFTSAPFVPVTDVANGCLRSSANYPTLVAEELGAELVDRSCGGARTADFSRSQFPDVPPQLSALSAGTDLVTVGIGGNDNRVYQLLTNRCPELKARDPQGAPCETYMRSRGGDILLDALARTRAQVTELVRTIRERAPQAKVLVVGYPQIVSTENVCDALPLAKGDYAYAVEVNRALTDALREAARATSSTYVDVWKASQGHDICSADPWVNGAVTDQQRALRYHPFAAEQAAVAELVLAAAGLA